MGSGSAAAEHLTNPAEGRRPREMPSRCVGVVAISQVQFYGNGRLLYVVAPQYKPVRPVFHLLPSGDTFTAVVQNLTVQYTTIKCQHVYGRSAKTGSSVHYY